MERLIQEPFNIRVFLIELLPVGLQYEREVLSIHSWAHPSNSAALSLVKDTAPPPIATHLHVINTLQNWPGFENNMIL